MNKLIFTPIEASNATEKYVDEIKLNDGDGMPLYIKKMEYSAKDRKGFMPVKRGEIITVLGRPGNGKTGLKLRWARMRANDLARKPNNKGVVLFLTMEQMVEELRLFHVAAENNISASDMASGQIEDWDSVKTSLRKLHTTPLWFAGKSNARRKDRVKITVDTIAESLAAIEKWTGDELDQSIDSVFIDYLQRFRSDGRDWVQFYGDTVNALKDLAGDFSTRIILGVQARREVDQRDLPIPQMDDGQWTSGIEQQSDGMISVCRPSHYKAKGESFDGVAVEGHEQMIVSVLKRKMGPENFKEWVKFSPEYNRLDEVEMKNYDMRKGYGNDE